MHYEWTEGTEGMGFETMGFEIEWITSLWTDEEGSDVTDLTIKGNSIPQHKPKHTKERQKERGGFWGQEFATECSCFSFSEVENVQKNLGEKETEKIRSTTND
jgi:hypothetical protein